MVNSQKKHSWNFENIKRKTVKLPSKYSEDKTFQKESTFWFKKIPEIIKMEYLNRESKSDDFLRCLSAMFLRSNQQKKILSFENRNKVECIFKHRSGNKIKCTLSTRDVNSNRIASFDAKCFCCSLYIVNLCLFIIMFTRWDLCHAHVHWKSDVIQQTKFVFDISLCTFFSLLISKFEPKSESH